MQVIYLEEEAFYALVEQVVSRLKEQSGVTHDRWISDEGATRLLNIKSKTTLQKLRDEGKVGSRSRKRKSFSMTESQSMNISNNTPVKLFSYGRNNSPLPGLS